MVTIHSLICWGEMLYLYYHPESDCAFATLNPPEVVMVGVDGEHCLQLSRDEYIAVCEKTGDFDPLVELLTCWGET